jgi:hypothetical protein
MTYDYTGYKPDGYQPWQREQDDVKALRLFIDHHAREFETRDAWVVTRTGDGQQFRAFSDETYAENCAGELRADLPEKSTVYGDAVKPRVLVSRVLWPAGCKTATVLSYLNDHIAEDFLLCIPPVPSVAYACPEFRHWGIGGPDNVEGGYAGVLELDGAELTEGGW